MSWTANAWYCSSMDPITVLDRCDGDTLKTGSYCFANPYRIR